MTDTELNEKSHQTAFEVFAQLHPVEAYDYDASMFCDYFRLTTGRKMSDEEIKEFVNKFRD